MKITRALQYVEQQRNVGYLTGFVRQLDKINKETWHSRQLPGFHGFLLQQTGNLEQAIPIHVPEGVALPADKSPVTVAVHVFGHTDPVTGKQTLRVKSLDISRPSIRAMPPSMVWSLDSNKKFGDDDFNPFGKGGTLKEALTENTDNNEEEFSETEKAIQEMLQASKGRLDTRLGQNSNVMMVAGFIDSYKDFLPDEHRLSSFWDLRLRQHEKRERCVPIRVYTKDMKGLGSKLRRGLPISITSQIRVKVAPNDEKDGLPEGIVYLRTDDVQAADRVRDILAIPSWYSKLREEQEEMKRKQREALQKASALLENTKSESDLERERLMGQLKGS